MGVKIGHTLFFCQATFLATIKHHYAMLYNNPILVLFFCVPLNALRLLVLGG